MQSRGCINPDNSHIANFSNQYVMKSCSNRAQSGGRRHRRSARKGRKSVKRGGGRLYSLVEDVERAIIGPKAGHGAVLSGDDVGVNACTNATSQQFYNEKLVGVAPLKGSDLKGGAKKRRGSKRGGGLSVYGGADYLDSIGEDYGVSSCGKQPLSLTLLSGGKKKRRARTGRKTKRGGRRARGSKRSGRKTRSRGSRKNKRGGSALKSGQDPSGYSLGGEYAPKQLLYGALASPAPYKPYNNCL